MESKTVYFWLVLLQRLQLVSRVHRVSVVGVQEAQLYAMHALTRKIFFYTNDAIVSGIPTQSVQY